ncbi:hypothetical protein H2198_002016 [Neophaeococcomyces mojaviensis]|uniref:Uncharacterized protein n=1 Tax=Neophaeococcomyces mojaviensis TaxID=3383035 RepID=A0ACC3AF65_9EURO|nr:hypothetical protein H2198_002016 [Knufia sp. JES_112]
MSFRAFVYIYILGGLTFLPLLLLAFLLFAYYTLPQPGSTHDAQKEDPAYLLRDGDEKVVLKTGTDDLAEKFHRKHESDVAAGYFAVCREYVPGGVNGKPPERLSPAGEVVAQESPSIYQNMYRSIFERVQKPSLEPQKDGGGKAVKRGSNVFYVVLRHGHLMLYDDVQQLEVRYVISLEYHDVDIYGGGEQIPEAELWIKRNAIRLRRKNVQLKDKSAPLPFFLFSENLSEKEDFYFAILNNMQKSIGDHAPKPQEFEVPHIITLVQRLHSSEEQLQTRWLNALLGRFFLAVYKTPELEALIRQKLTKKIARVKKPDFITKLALQKIDTGTGAPFFTNPRLRDLTVNGDCTVEADVEYSGSARVEIAATVRIDLGARLKAREVDIVLAATCKKLSGHILARFKPQPSNRIWVSFEKVPKVELKLEPIVSSRQITYGFILRSIESRILEVIAETVVLPFWDDIPFTHTEAESFRGGIWQKDVQQNQSTEIKDEEAEDEAEAGTGSSTPNHITKEERVMSMPVLTDSNRNTATAAAKKSMLSLRETMRNDGAKTPEKTSRQSTPRILRSSSFAGAAEPMVSPSHAPGDTRVMDMEATSKRDSMLKDLSSRSLGTSPESGVNTPPKDDHTSTTERNRTESFASHVSSSSARGSRRGSDAAETTVTGSIQSQKTNDSLNPDSKRSSLHGDGKGFARNFGTPEQREKTLASINAAKEAAQKWGWGVLARNRPKEPEARTPTEDSHKHDTLQPMGRGQPLPPPGQPLPKPSKPSVFSLPKRKPVPLPAGNTDTNANTPRGDITPSTSGSPPKKPPPLPDRKRRQSQMQNNEDEGQDEVMVVEAPAESPTTPPSPEGIDHEHLDEFFGHGEAKRAEQREISNPELSEQEELAVTNGSEPSRRAPPPLPKRPETGDGTEEENG